MQLLAFLLLPLLLPRTKAFPYGAGDCPGGRAAVYGSHMIGDFTTGDLDDGGIRFEIDGTSLDPGDTITVDGTLDTHTWSLSGGFRGFLVRLEGDADFSDAFVSNGGGVQDSDLCSGNVGGATHTDRDDKDDVSGELILEGNAEVDVTVVIENFYDAILDTHFSTYYYSSFTIEVSTPEPTEEPTAPPSPSPTSSPTLEPTENPTKSPTNAPTKLPTDAPTPTSSDAPTGTPSQGPTKTPTASPTDEPTDEPSAGPTGSPTPKPSPGPTVSPTKKPTGSPTKQPTPGPTRRPTASPTKGPTKSPTKQPTPGPTTSEPASSPTFVSSATTRLDTCLSSDSCPFSFDGACDAGLDCAEG